jgi:hypothetical protein
MLHPSDGEGKDANTLAEKASMSAESSSGIQLLAASDPQTLPPQQNAPTQRLFVVATISQDRTGSNAEVIGKILARR